MGRPALPLDGRAGGALFDAALDARYDLAQLQLRFLPVGVASTGPPGVVFFALPGLDFGRFAVGAGIHATTEELEPITFAWSLRFGTAAGGHFSLLVAHSEESGPGIEAVDTELQ